MNKILYLICSPAGGGKSTKALTLAPKEYIFEADQYYINQKGEYFFDPSKIGHAHTSCQRKAEQAMINGVERIVVSNTSTTHKERKPYLEMAKKHGYEVMFTFPDSPWFKEVHPRLISKTFTDKDVQTFVEKTIHRVPFESIKRMMARWEEP